MATLPLPWAPIAAMCGVALHLLYFNRGEHHMYGVRYIQVSVISFLVSLGISTYAYGIALVSSLAIVSFLASSLLLGLFSSLLCYRLIWHPLRDFPGPPLARISSLWLSTQNVKGHNHRVSLALFNKYGPFVRIGSSDLMIVHPKGIPAVHGAQSRCRKASWYDLDSPRQSLHTTRDHKSHHARRRVWSPAFSDRALRGYEGQMAVYSNALIERLAGFKGQPANASRWFNYYSFDLMGDLSFGRDFGMLKSGEEHWAVALINEAFDVLRLALPSWIPHIAMAIPGAMKDHWKFMDYCNQQLAAKIADEEKLGDPDSESLMSLLIAHANKNPSDQEQLTLQSDSRVVIVAGSDTTAAAMSYLFYELAHHPEHVELLRRELLPLVSDDGSFDHRKLRDADHLNAVISEVLRLHPPVSTQVSRNTPPEGIYVDGTFIPGNVTVWTPQWALGRADTAYEKAYEFIPERWYSQPALIKDKDGYAPFGIGPYGCIGRPLAQMQLRAITAQIVMRFDVEFPPGGDGSAFIENTTDRFTWGLADLPMCFKPRA